MSREREGVKMYPQNATATQIFFIACYVLHAQAVLSHWEKITASINKIFKYKFNHNIQQI